MRAYKTILRNRAYMLFWSGMLISSFGDSFTTFGLAWYVLRRTHSPISVGLTFLIYQLPSLFSGLIAGWLLDRFRREVVMTVDNVLRGLLVIIIPLLDAHHMLSFPMLYCDIALLGALSVFTDVGSRAILPELVPTSEYNTANSFDVMQRQMSFILGPSLAGILVVVLGPLNLLWIDGGSFFVFAFCLMLLSFTLRSSTIQNRKQEEHSDNLWRELLEGVRFTLHTPLLLALTSISFFWNFGLGLFAVALPFYCERALRVGPAGMGMLLSVNSIGVLLSAIVFGPLRPRHPGRIACILLIVQAVCYGLLALIPPFIIALAIYFVLGACDDIGAIYLTTVRQRVVPERVQGRVWAFTGIIGSSGEPLGSGIAGLLAFAFGATLLVGASGLPLLLIGILWLVIGPVRRVNDERI